MVGFPILYTCICGRGNQHAGPNLWLSGATLVAEAVVQEKQSFMIDMRHSIMRRIFDRIHAMVTRDIVRLWRGGVMHIGVATGLSRFGYIIQRIVLARLLGASGVGHIAVVSSVLRLVQLPAGGGVFTAVTKLMAETETGECQRKRVLGTTLIINMATAIATCVVAYPLVRFSPLIKDPIARSILAVILLFVPVLIMNRTFSSALQGLRRMRTLARAEILSAALGVFLMIAAVWLLGLPGWTLATIGSFFISALLLGWPLRSAISLQWDSAVAKRIGRIGVFAFLAQLLGALMMQFDTLSVSGLLDDPSLTGIYNSATLVIQQLMTVPGTILMVAFPRVARDRSDIVKLKRDYAELSLKLLGLSAGIVVLTWFAAPLFFRILGKDFVLSASPFRVLLMGFLARTLYVLDNTYLDALGRTDLHFYTSIVSVAVMIALNLVMIPRWGIMGAAWATASAMVLNLAIKRFAVGYFIFLKQRIR
jgi:O-antigen/teichoic acid export membrane protein